MPKYKVIILPLAEEDILAQTDYIAYEFKNLDAAINMARGFNETINNLSIFPQCHGLDEDERLAGYGVRKTYYKNYKIYYTIDECKRVVYVLRVLHVLLKGEEKVLHFLKKYKHS